MSEREEDIRGKEEVFKGWPPHFELGQEVTHVDHEGERGWWFGRSCVVLGRRLNGRYSSYSDGYDYLIGSEGQTKLVISADLSKAGS